MAGFGIARPAAASICVQSLPVTDSRDGQYCYLSSSCFEQPLSGRADGAPGRVHIVHQQYGRTVYQTRSHDFEGTLYRVRAIRGVQARAMPLGWSGAQQRALVETQVEFT